MLTYTSDDPTQPQYRDDFDIDTHGSGFWPVGESGPEPQKLPAEAHQFYRLGQALVRRISELGR